MSDRFSISEIRGAGPPDKRSQIIDELDQITDPCSVGIGRPIGLVGMGIVEAVDVEVSQVSVLILPTFPNCLFRGVIEDEIAKRLSRLDWCANVTVGFCPADQSWDESRMSNEALRTLGRKPKRTPIKLPLERANS